MKTFKTKAGTELALSSIQGRDYLQVAPRLIWFREEHADWAIETEIAASGQDWALFRATIKNEQGRVLATAHKVETRQGFSDFHEKCETGAIGRALALVGYGTQFAQELDEGERIVDSPQGTQGRPQEASRAASNGLATPESDDAVTVPAGRDKGVPISKLSTESLRKDVAYWRGREASEGKSLGGGVSKFVCAAERVLARREAATPKVEEQDVPFNFGDTP
jgi:hypothetical protein